MMKVSIITIVYNNAANIETCLQSVICQSYQNIEYIIIDGGSTDSTVDIIHSYQSRLKNLTFISEKDNGLYNALNKGIRMATGDIIGILHSDDLFYSENVISEVAEIFNSTNADLVYANGMYVDKSDINKIKRIYKSSGFKRYRLQFGWIPLHTTIYVKQNIFTKYGLYEEKYKIAGDYEISLRWFTNENIRKVFLNKWVVKMRLGGKSTTLGLQKLKSSEDLVIIRKYKLSGYFTLASKIIRKIHQYIYPYLLSVKNEKRVSGIN
ncbi:MAG: glycosyltransferase family 2 protein [Lacibacter sp.]